MLQHLILLAIAVLGIGLTFLVLHWPQGTHRTFSQHAAAQSVTIMYYILLFSIVVPIMLIFFTVWFVPTLHLPGWFIVFIGFSGAMMIVVTLVPEIGGWWTRLHWLLAFLSAVALLPCLAIISFSGSLSFVSRSVAAISLTSMCCIMIATAILKVQHAKLLYMQTGFFIAFFSAILVATYLR